MDFNLINQKLAEIAAPSYRYDQLQKAVKNGAGDWDQIKGWPQSLIGQFKNIPFYSFTDSQVFESVDGTKKAKLTLPDHMQIETVLMFPKPNQASVCVSCEVGCPMGCTFCATGTMGLKRRLTSEEITDQWLFWQNYNPKHIVFMGMGEPFNNQTEVFKAIQSLSQNYSVGMRKISVSTSGVVPGIQALAQAFPQVNLAISLHAATDEIRSQLMPINQAYSLTKLAEAIKKYMRLTGRQVMFEYILLDGVNNSSNDLSSLIRYLKSFPKNLIHVNLIRYNPTNPNLKMPSNNRVRAFRNGLKTAGISVTIRKNLGTDIMGACGQLVTATSNLV